MPDAPAELPLRIVVVGPLAGVRMALQRGKAELVEPASAWPDALVFDFSVRVAPVEAGQPPRLLGPMVQGPPQGRFVYVNSGTLAGQAGSSWTRRAKVPLSGIDWVMIRALEPGQRLQARIAGVERRGGPCCASVPLLDGGWRPVSGDV
jgi:hypothetical protein